MILLLDGMREVAVVVAGAAAEVRGELAWESGED